MYFSFLEILETTLSYGKIMKTIILTFAVFIMGTALSRAQDSILSVNSTTISLSLYFSQGDGLLDPSFRGNGERMELFKRKMSGLIEDTTKTLQKITVSSGASPEGASDFNHRLSDSRMAAVCSYIKRICPVNNNIITVNSKGVDWNGLERMVRASGMPWREKVLNIINDTPEWVIENGKVIDSRKRRLMRLDGGKAWYYMNERFFPDLRGGSIDVVFEFALTNENSVSDIAVADIPASHETTVSDSLNAECTEDKSSDTIPEYIDAVADTITAVLVRNNKRQYIFGAGTNLVFDALLIPNVSLELPFASHWSVGTNWMYGWKERDAKRSVYAYGGELHVRYWLTSATHPLTGHHFGVYGQMVRYNIHHSGRGYLSDRWSYGAGIEYGFSLPLYKRLRLDMAVGAGYITGICREYVRQDECDVWQETKRRNWLGPTKAEISLIWLIGHVNRKGGGK